MINLLAIGDPIIDTHVQIDANCLECHLASDSKHLCLNYGEKIPIVDSFQSLGGNAPNVAIGAAKLGLRSAVVSTVGQDAYGQLAVEQMRRHGVDTSLITFDAAHQTRYSIILNYQGERTILSYSEEKNYQWPEKIPATDWIYYTGLSKGFEIIQEKLLAYLPRHLTLRLAVNPGSYLMKYAKRELCEVLPHTDLLIVNREEGEKILGTTLEKEKNIAALIHGLLKTGPKEIALTDGKNGAWAGNAGELWFMPAYPATVMAKTGAGDAFSAGYIAARFNGHDIATALQWGSANSAGVIQAHGPHGGLLDKPGIADMIKSFANIGLKKL